MGKVKCFFDGRDEKEIRKRREIFGEGKYSFAKEKKNGKGKRVGEKQRWEMAKYLENNIFLFALYPSISIEMCGKEIEQKTD